MKYEVEITRISYATLAFGVEASSEEEAKRIAMNMASNTGWDEDYADYEINNCSETELTDKEWKETYGE